MAGSVCLLVFVLPRTRVEYVQHSGVDARFPRVYRDETAVSAYLQSPAMALAGSKTIALVVYSHNRIEEQHPVALGALGLPKSLHRVGDRWRGPSVHRFP